MRRILILGISGAGKSTLARLIGKKLGIPIMHLDSIFWKPGWVMPEQSEWDQKLIEISKSESWIIDGNYASSYPILMPLADLIVVLDPPMPIAFIRVFKRVLLTRLGLYTHKDTPVGCRQKIDRTFFTYIWNFPKDRRPLIDQALAEFKKDQQVKILKSSSDLDSFIKDFLDQ